MKILLLIALLGWLLDPQVGLVEQQVSSPLLKTRQIIQTPGTPIASQLLHDDEMVLVEPAGFETSITSTTVLSVQEDLDLRATGSDLIMVAENVASEGFLINDGSWVRSKLTFRPIRVIKDSKTVINDSAGLVTVFHDGGDVRVKGVLVRAGYFYLYNRGARYLLFLRSFARDNNATFSLQMAVSADNKLSPMELSTGRTFPASSRLFGLDLDVVLSGLSRRLAPKK